MRVNQIVALDDLEFWIRQKSKRVSSFFDHVLPSLRGRVNADSHYTNPGLVKLDQILLETSQLEVTISSPIAAVKNQEHAFWRLVVDRFTEQLSQRQRLVI